MLLEQGRCRQGHRAEQHSSRGDCRQRACSGEILVRSLRSHLIAVVAQVKKNPFKLPSLLTPDPSASIAQNLVLHGRTLDVSRAVTRDEASKLKEAGERQREKADKRNLYLLREGSEY